jgi:hypothetical protein
LHPRSRKQLKAAAGADPIAVIACGRQLFTGNMSMVDVLIAKTIARRAHRRNEAHHNQQCAEQKPCDFAPSFDSVEHAVLRIACLSLACPVHPC